MKEVLTTCPYCGTGCAFYLQVHDDTVTGVRPAVSNTVNKGRLCSKGHFGFDFIHHGDRLKTPLIRRDGRLVPCSWEEAYDCITSRLSEIIRQSGPDAVAGFSSARCTNEENYLMQKFMRAAVGTNNVDHCARL
ncbi:hypothetical protein RDSD_000412 [Oleidesulfovibrio alaskensis]|jgi:formate dehydrogenase major subunit